jgi:hypothetical protein
MFGTSAYTLLSKFAMYLTVVSSDVLVTVTCFKTECAHVVREGRG